MYNPIQFERKAILTHRTQPIYTKPTKGDYLLTWYFSNAQPHAHACYQLLSQTNNAKVNIVKHLCKLKVYRCLYICDKI
ncbi:hypothetical protein Hanom_Chr16g01517981 [Helianthus anomalus]